MLKTSCLCIVVLLLNSFNLNGETLELKGHDREVTSTCFSPNGSQVVSGSKDKTVRIWDAKTGKNIQTLNGHADVVTCVCFSPDGSQVVSGSEDKTVRIWDAKTGKNIQTFIAHDTNITAIDFSPDGEFIATGCNDNSMKIWNSSNCKMVHKLEGHSAKILDLNFSPNSKQLVSCSERDGLYGRIKVWDILSGKEIYSVRGDPRRTVRGIANQLQGDINAVKFSPDGKQFASAGANMTINLWDGPSGALIRTFECDLLRTDGPGHSGPVRSLGFSPSVSVIVSNSNNTAKFWDTRTGKEIYTLRGNGDPMKGIKFSPEGKRVIVSQEKGIFITNLEKLDFLGEAVIPKVLVTPETPAKKEAKLERTKLINKKSQEINNNMVLIPAGTFNMGSTKNDILNSIKNNDFYKDKNKEETDKIIKKWIIEERKHEVVIPNPFYIGKYEVTQEEWVAVMGYNPCSRTKGPKLPVDNINWYECKNFIEKLNENTNGGYRLPTEAEWEYACRAGTSTAYSFGDKITPKDANYSGSKLDKPVEVGSYKPNAFGLYDMHGNVSEWCEDWWEDYSAEAVTDPKGPATGKYRVLRGGSFYRFEPSACGSSFRNYRTPSDPRFYYGFRLVRGVDNKTGPTPSVQKPDPPEIKPATKHIVEAPFSEAKAKEAQKETAKNLQKEVAEIEILGKEIKLEMVIIPAGTFMRGSPSSEKGRYDNETQHEVTITKPFYIGKYEVTQEQWEAVMGDNPSRRTKEAKLPITDVSWEDCRDFIKKLNSKTNGGYRLPTEAEWEYACRAGTTTAYFFGDSLTKSDANYGDGTLGITKTVGSYKPNAFGLYDMHGNVWEWCADWKEEYPSVSATDPMGVPMGIYRVLRGGSFDGNGLSARSSYRFNSSRPSNRDDDLGFRLARTADIKASVASPTETNPVPTGVIPAGNQLVAPFTEIKAKDIQKEVAKSLKKEVDEKADLGKGIKLEMVLIPAGKFMMGSLASEEGRHEVELPQHEVTLTKPFYMGRYEVTQDQWEAVMGNNPSETKGAKLPVTNVTWLDCQEFIKKLNAKTDGGYRLPMEAEWEYACRAGTTTANYFGDTITPKDANYINLSLKMVGSYKPNAFGLYDMYGNVWEWCEERYGKYLEGAAIDPKGSATGEKRVLRGGSFDSNESAARSSGRGGAKPSVRDVHVGFRLARTI